jgi:hypothetical protein
MHTQGAGCANASQGVSFVVSVENGFRSRQRRGVFALVAGTALLIVSHAATAAAQRAGPAPAAATGWVYELGGGAYREAWNYNLSDEDLGGLAAGLLYRATPHWSVGAELIALGVHQDTVPAVAVGGGNWVIRWQHRATRRADYFGEIGGGATDATGIVPARGTDFNWLAQSGGGVIVAIRPRAQLRLGITWLHLSNAGRAGADHNPDIQSIGVRIGLIMPLPASAASIGS